LHKQARDAWGYGRQEDLSKDELIEEKYRGIRPAAGYPACPDHTEKGPLWKLLDVQKNTGMILTESFAMWPGSSVSGLYFAHPQAHYFGVGKIERDQVDDALAGASGYGGAADVLGFHPGRRGFDQRDDVPGDSRRRRIVFHISWRQNRVRQYLRHRVSPSWSAEDCTSYNAPLSGANLCCA